MDWPPLWRTKNVSLSPAGTCSVSSWIARRDLVSSRTALIFSDAVTVSWSLTVDPLRLRLEREGQCRVHDQSRLQRACFAAGVRHADEDQVVVRKSPGATVFVTRCDEEAAAGSPVCDR